jgi:hypothetical protein
MSEFKPYKATVHLKHTGHELICDVIGETTEAGLIRIKNPCTLQTVTSQDGQSQMAMVPYLMTSKIDEVSLKALDILFINECREDVAQQHTQMFSNIVLPKTRSQFDI